MIPIRGSALICPGVYSPELVSAAPFVMAGFLSPAQIPVVK
jgi:hypothetical protein